VNFSDGRANLNQKITAREIAGLLGMDTADMPTRRATGAAPGGAAATTRFLDQLQDSHPDAALGVADVMANWKRVGGTFSYGEADETSCFLMLGTDRWEEQDIWPFAIYPRAGTVEVVFQHMRRRPVFVELELREQFRDRLAGAGITIPDAKLSLRPSFPIAVLADDARRGSVNQALSWFAATFHYYLEPDEAAVAATQETAEARFGTP